MPDTAWAEAEGSDLVIGCSQAENALAIQIPGCNYDKQRKLWHAPLSWPAWVAFTVVWQHQPHQVGPELQAWAHRAWADVQIAYGLRAALDAPDEIAAQLLVIEATLRDDGKHLFPFQRGGAAWLALQRRAALIDPQGNGKTVQAIRALQVAQLRGSDALPALVICAGAMAYGWHDELAAWAPELTVQVVTGTVLRRRQALAEPADVYVIPWPDVRLHTRLAAWPGQAYVRCPEHGGASDKVTPAKCEVHPKELNGLGIRTVIADEAHRMARPKTKWTRAVWHLAGEARYFWPMTGTPVADTISDLWPVAHGIDPRAFPARSRYTDLYAVKQHAWHGGTEILGIRPENEAAYHATVQPLLRRIPKEIARPEMPDRLPPVFRYPPMHPAQARLYKQLSKALLADLPTGHVMVPGNSLTVFGRLCQVACASLDGIDGEDGDGFTRPEVAMALPSSKADDLIDFLGDNPGQLVVAASSAQLVALCERKLDTEKIAHARVTGGMSADEQHQAVSWFQDGIVRVIFITAAGAESITLTAADTILFLQPEPSFIKREQKIGRIDRIGQPNPVRVVYSITPCPVERRLFALGEDKAERAGAVTRDADLLRWIVSGEDEAADEMEPAGAG